MVEYTISIVDNHPLLLEGVAALVRRKPGLRLSAMGSTVGHIRSITANHRPDAMILDFNMPGDALRAILAVLSDSPATKILVFTASTDTELAIELLDAGVSGFVLKSSSTDELCTAIDAIRRGEVFISPSFAARIIGALNHKPCNKRPTPAPSFSARENQIVRLLSSGKRNREIANALSLSEKTVKGYMTLLMQKLHARNRLEAVIAVQGLSQAAALRGDIENDGLPRMSG
ncbi:Two component transcriptional regulator, LuxR family [Bosea sp. LC85]|uniref:LuxR C-terminal-related transcriptional regulator n=1 Tax=Bosea sp. LC85 TaxID=1502851 RepID=UPI0004E363DE|nr:response regulator transcription factor [Bosea sp. LC85]KFC69673.1 Two component transcriptional regulator, LuxR family [Bosea sp. LC85]